ncbi:GNAT family N-acetyltransferase [Motiliproteus sp. MSK22-1]|uniref:GNAT family N-acetyltransferase n=1 Tax=Motiliproteus sp. MSK22-1 TaxID=1897630 RepID=UPI000975981F|nr:GNAT family N-acetyltransferase [Motiliproteus sp. MSK22-1]OMH29447.1 GNAT family N-acetyltransferase [Motiliproteus sp. MSK22-1]
MYCLEYVKLSEIEPIEFLPLLNKQTTRDHLIDHELFDSNKVKEWIQAKINVDASPGCRVRAIRVDKQLAGWCGIQLEDGKYEIAVVIEDRYWGLGKTVFPDILTWAKELGHTTVFIHLLHTRPEYKFLRKMSKRVYESELLGTKFTTYELKVETVDKTV